MKLDNLFNKALNFEHLSMEEGVYLYEKAPLNELIFAANQLKSKIHTKNIVTWQIDRNVNITNVCVSFCKFCNFCRKKRSEESYITTIGEYKSKIEELLRLGGNQLLLQGGLHPDLGVEYYEQLFRELKSLYPTLRLHALGPPEIAFIARKDELSPVEVLKRLKNAGLDSLPGAGAEILVDRVRKIVSPVKCDTQTWLDIMHEAHKIGLTTSATMMFGHVETKAERIEHMIRVRETQSLKSESENGFLAFIAWPFMDEGTTLQTKYGISNKLSTEEFIRTIAVSRLMLPNIPNIQASWLTVGVDVAQLSLHAGANDMGSIMIEENVVSSAGVRRKMDRAGMQQAIEEAGFDPRLRDQNYNILD